MLASVAWILQLGALVVVGSALLVGLVYDALRVELGLLVLGSLMFLLGRWLGRGGQ
jgi:hypothetical protein